MPTRGELRTLLAQMRAAIGNIEPLLAGNAAEELDALNRDRDKVAILVRTELRPAMDRLTGALNLNPTGTPAVPVAATPVIEAPFPGQPPDVMAFTAGAAALRGPEPKRADFAEFLTEIGGAMVQAQAALDLASDAYSHGSGPLVAPTSYRIPKLTAALRFALEKTADKGFDLLVWSSRTAERELNQQSLDLELVAVPAAPDFAQALAARLPRLSLLTGPAERGPILDAFAAADPAVVPPAAKRHAGRLVVAIGRPRDDGAGASMQDLLLLLSTPDDAAEAANHAGLWYWTLQDGRPVRQPAVVMPFARVAPGSALAMLDNFAEPLSAAQGALAPPP